MTTIPLLSAVIATAALALPQTNSTRSRPQDSGLPATASSRPAKPVRAWGVVWQPDLDAALALAQQKQRPVAWFRVLGELQGGC